MSDSSPTKILIIYAHPDSTNSAVNKALINEAKTHKNVTITDLYAKYPDSKINIATENKLLAAHDVIIFQFPLYWYSSPALLKEWQDVVLVEGQTYGPKTSHLSGKTFLCAVSLGVEEAEFSPNGAVGIPLRDILMPFELTAKYCDMQTMPPFVYFHPASSNVISHIAQNANQYGQLLSALSHDKLDIKSLQARKFINNSPLPLIQETT